MATFAHIETGQVMDPQPNDTAAQYLARYPGLTAKWDVVQVPDGTEHNAVVNGDGTYTNPPTPQPIAPSEVDPITVLTQQVSALQAQVTALAGAISPAAATAVAQASPS